LVRFLALGLVYRRFFVVGLVVVVTVVLVVIVILILIEGSDLVHLDVLFGRLPLGQRDRHGEDAAVVGGADVVLVGAVGQRHRPRERSIRELRDPV
jgi:hypothetical protein